jgi:hypothetical protein
MVIICTHNKIPAFTQGACHVEWYNKKVQVVITAVYSHRNTSAIKENGFTDLVSEDRA